MKTLKQIFQLPKTLPKFYKSNVSEQVLIDFNKEEFVYLVGIVDVRVLEGEIETLGFTITVDSPTTTLYSSGSHGLISIASTGDQKATVLLEKSSRTSAWQKFMNDYAPIFSMFDIKDWRLMPCKRIAELEKDLGCGFDLSITPMSNQRLVFNQQWKGFSDDLLGRPINQSIKVLLAGYKNSGKSTMMCYFINKCLKKWKKILVLDLDIGQSEFTLPGCVSAFIVDKPLLGPNFTHMLQPFKSYFFGSTDVTHNIPLYNKMVKKLLNDVESVDLLHIPCFINTMGFVEGVGLEILYNILTETKPSDVVQLKFDERQDLNLHWEIVNDHVQSSLTYDLWYFISAVKNKYARAPQLQENAINKHDLQQLITTAYFSRCLGCTDIYFNDIIPYKINFSNISTEVNDVDKITKDEYLKTLNTNVIVLCVSTTTTSADLFECVGFGIVRNVNLSTGDIYVVTPVAPDLLNRVNHFKLWINKYLPSTFFSVGTTVSKYCHVKQDNIFNENVARHYKVML